MNINKLIVPDFFPGRLRVYAEEYWGLLKMLAVRPNKESFRLAKMILKVKPRHTMAKNGNLLNLHRLAGHVAAEKIPGDLVECGVWNGGSSAIMGKALMECGGLKGRRLWLFDSFEGVPKPGEKDGWFERTFYFKGWNKGDIQHVREAFARLNVPMDNVRIVPGWFNQTLKSSAVERIALLHIDADWYDSVRDILEAFYERVVPGGFVVLDDYGSWQGCRSAVHDFISMHGLAVKIVRVSRIGAFFQMP